MSLRSETRATTIPAPRGVVHAYLADVENLPEWAPAFAASGFDVDFLADAKAGTVDIVAARDHTVGAFMRVLPNGDGSELLFTLLFPPEVPGAVVEEQMATVEAELAAVRDACAQSASSSR